VEKERIRKVLAIIKDVSVEISEQTGIEPSLQEENQ
jgi:hypothetical protein